MVVSVVLQQMTWRWHHMCATSFLSLCPFLTFNQKKNDTAQSQCGTKKKEQSCLHHTVVKIKINDCGCLLAHVIPAMHACGVRQITCSTEGSPVSLSSCLFWGLNSHDPSASLQRWHHSWWKRQQNSLHWLVCPRAPVSLSLLAL